MAVQAFTRQNGRHDVETLYDQIYLDYTNTKYPNESRVEHYSWSGVYHVDQRYRGSSPKYLLPNSSTVFRNSSDYEQTCYHKHREYGIWKLVVPFQTFIINDIIRGGDSKFDTNPIAMDDGSVIWSDELASAAQVKAIQRMKGKTVGVGQDLAEAQKTYRSLVANGVTLLRAALALKNGNLPLVWRLLRDNRSAIRRGSDLYLEYKFGWKPLMSDIYGLSELFKQQAEPAFLVKSSGKSSRESFTPNTNSSYVRQPTGENYRQASCILHGILDPSVNRTIQMIGLSNPLSLGWELVPFSFVVDWFAPVGPVLDALQAPFGINFLTGSTTMKGELHYIQHWLPDAGWIEISPRTVSYEAFSIRRRSHGDWPKPGLFATNPFSSNHGASAFALLLQRFVR